MKTKNHNAEAADRFGAVAQEFCSTVESASKIDRANFLTEVYRVLPRLINEAICLPGIESSGEEDATQENESSPTRPRVSMPEEQWGHLYNLLKQELGNWDPQVFDPTADKEAIFGSLADDIADIYRDLKEGLVLGETHQARPEDIIWEWRLLYYSHWGKHAIDALHVLHFRLGETLS